MMREVQVETKHSIACRLQKQTKVNTVSSRVNHTGAGKKFHVLLMTAIVNVMDNKKQHNKVRAFLTQACRHSLCQQNWSDQVLHKSCEPQESQFKGLEPRRKVALLAFFSSTLSTALEKDD